MVGVTIANNDKFYEMAKIAANSVAKHAKIPTLILTNGKSYSFWLWKFELFDLFPNETVFYFDSDTVLLKDVDLKQFNDQEEFIAVQDQYIVGHSDLQNNNLEHSSYFNSGVMFFNHRHKEIATWVENKRITRPINTTFYGQTYWNLAVKELNIPLKLLPSKWNYLRYHPDTSPTDVIIGHYTFHNNNEGQKNRLLTLNRLKEHMYK